MSDIAFTCAYWDWLRLKVALEPNAAQYGLSWEMGEVLKRQITIEAKHAAKNPRTTH